MSKPWHGSPLWEKFWLGPHSKVYLHAGRIVGHLGCGGFAFWDAAKLLPTTTSCVSRTRCATSRSTSASAGEYELHADARQDPPHHHRPAPDDPGT